MRKDKIEVYVHIIWTTFDREQLISPALENDLYPLICGMGERHGARTVAINGMPDHVHWLVKFSSTTQLSALLKDAKGTSSKFAKERLGKFRWRGSYAAFSVSRWNVRSVATYIALQNEHHANGTIKPKLESGWDDDWPCE